MEDEMARRDRKEVSAVLARDVTGFNQSLPLFA